MTTIHLPSKLFWNKKKVGITGHQGFKGAWLCMLLAKLGSNTYGYGHDERFPLLYRNLDIENHSAVNGNINDLTLLKKWLRETQPEFLIHLAAQPIVLDSYNDPLGTFRDNICGTATVLEAARDIASLKSIIVVTSDKVYRNNEHGLAFTEKDELGGDDPYSASKAAAEIVTRAMARSFFRSQGAPHVHSVRAGNVIGGGDWASHRLLPDAVRAFAAGERLTIRSPEAVRPWQHVLDPLSGYLLLCEMLASAGTSEFEAWNFGPDASDTRSVKKVIGHFCEIWGEGAEWSVESSDLPVKEANLLSVDSSKARSQLDWHPRWAVDLAVKRTANWYRKQASGDNPTSLIEADIDAFLGGSETDSG